MKTFRDFILEARRFVPKDEAQAKFDQLPPEEQAIRTLRNSGTNRGGWGTKLKSSLKNQRQRRKERIVQATGPQTPKEAGRTQTKYDLARSRGQDVHHNVEIETSAKEFKNLSPEQIEAKKKEDAKKGRYHGDDRRNLVLGNKGVDLDAPGFSHGAFHQFERGNRKKLNDIQTAISPQRAYVVLINKRRREKRAREREQQNQG